MKPPRNGNSNRHDTLPTENDQVKTAKIINCYLLPLKFIDASSVLRRQAVYDFFWPTLHNKLEHVLVVLCATATILN
jgi:hypothetical protein